MDNKVPEAIREIYLKRYGSDYVVFADSSNHQESGDKFSYWIVNHDKKVSSRWSVTFDEAVKDVSEEHYDYMVNFQRHKPRVYDMGRADKLEDLQDYKFEVIYTFEISKSFEYGQKYRISTWREDYYITIDQEERVFRNESGTIVNIMGWKHVLNQFKKIT